MSTYVENMTTGMTVCVSRCRGGNQSCWPMRIIENDPVAWLWHVHVVMDGFEIYTH
jgi:hypothetical protein